MATLDNLRAQGWHLTSEGLAKVCENERGTDLRTITRKALDIDIRDIGAPIISSEIIKHYFGPVVLQIVKLKNISAPKSKQSSQGAPRMLKLVLTDGHANCQGIETKQIQALSLDKTVPGTKLLITGAQVVSGAILLTPDVCKVLGGTVSVLVEKWELSKLMPSHIRVNEDGPPAWVNFGKKVITNLTKDAFKSLENKNKENTKENAEFQVQRQDAIAEAAQGAVKKVFGGGVKPAQTFNSFDANNQFNNSQPRAPRPMKNRKDKTELEKCEKPSQRVSLFDFLEDKLPVTDSPLSKNSTKPFNEPAKQGRGFPEPPRKFNDFPPQRQKYENKESAPQIKTFQNNNAKEMKFKGQQNHFKQDDIKIKQHQPSDSRYQNDRNYPQSDGRYQNDRNSHQSENRYQNSTQSENRYSDRSSDTSYQNDRNSQPSDSRYQNVDTRYNDRNVNSDTRFNDRNSDKRYQNERNPNADTRYNDRNSHPEARYQNDRNNTSLDGRVYDRNSQQPDTRYQTDRPPRFQKQQRNPTSTESPRSKPNTHNFVDKLTNEINNISLYNTKYEIEKLHKPPAVKNAPVEEEINGNWKWKIGDRCMAKYWEDNKYYNAVVTGITNRTCMVEFMEYGNYEEVLHCDCIPVTPEKPERQQKSFTDNQQFSGSLEFRRGKNRPFVRTPNNKPQNKHFES